jgi:hypothetical protein
VQPRFLCSDSGTVRTVPAINVVRILEKNAPRNLMLLYGGRTTCTDQYVRHVPSICVLLYGQNKYNKVGRTKSVLYGFFLAADLPRNSCPSLLWNSVPLFCCKPFFRKLETSLLLLSLNLSISPRKNDFSFGLFPPLESLSDF